VVTATAYSKAIDNQPSIAFKMSRGNQRDTDRQKRQAKLQKMSNGNQREGTPASRNEDDKAKLLAKLEAKKAKAQDDANAATQSTKKTVVRKKVAKQADNLDDLLNAGLSGGKKKKKK
jgi:hypothetical protein